LEPYPRLQKLFSPLSRCIKHGKLHEFDLALQEGEEEFVKRRIYLTLERGRDIALRNLLRKVFIAGGYDEPKEPGAVPVRRTRVPVAEFAAAITLGSQERLDGDEVECLLANMIYKVSRHFPVPASVFLTLVAMGHHPDSRLCWQGHELLFMHAIGRRGFAGGQSHDRSSAFCCLTCHIVALLPRAFLVPFPHWHGPGGHLNA
jgi:hypothetical protein